MKEYIEKAVALEAMSKSGVTCNMRAHKIVASIPAADVAPVRHGRWEFPIFADSDDELDPRVRCSECGGIEAAFARWKCCPNCGARMDKEDEHEA